MSSSLILSKIIGKLTLRAWIGDVMVNALVQSEIPGMNANHILVELGFPHLVRLKCK